MKVIELSVQERGKFLQVLDYVQETAEQNQWAVGAAEMAAGVALITAGLSLGDVGIGPQIVGLDGPFNWESLAGAGAGATAGAIAGKIIGGIGLAAGGTAIGIPASILALGGAAVLGAFGYAVGDAVHNFLTPPIDLASFAAGASLSAIGLALIFDGAKRLMGDAAFRSATCNFADECICLFRTTRRVVIDATEYAGRTIVENKEAVGGTSGAVAGAAAGAAVGTSVAASSVTVLGSQALGSAALSMGLVSAPVLPVVAVGAAGAAAGYGLWKAGSWLFSAK
jgi:hypothetical protein